MGCNNTFLLRAILLMELISVEQGNKKSEQLIQETINKYKKIGTE